MKTQAAPATDAPRSAIWWATGKRGLNKPSGEPYGREPLLLVDVHRWGDKKLRQLHDFGWVDQPQ